MNRTVPRKFGAVALFFASVFAARADLVVKQRVEGGGQSADQVIRVKDSKARCDVTNAVSVIVNRETGETTTLAHAQRGYITLDAARRKVLSDKMEKARGSAESPPLVATGKKEKVGDQMCDIFTADLGAVKVTYWLAKDYPNFAALNAQLDVLESASGTGMGGGIAPRTKDLPGFPMKIQMEMGAQKVTVTVNSVTDEKVDPAIFEVPKGYKELPSTPPPPPAP